MNYKNLVIIGTSHIAKESLDRIEKAMKEHNPGIIALELDKKRYISLLDKSSPKKRISLYAIRKVGIRGFIFSLIGAWAEYKLGKHAGVLPGSEMVKAASLAKKNKIKIALIDQDIEVTLQRISRYLSWKEKWNFLADLFKAFVLRRKEVSIDITKVPEKKLIKKLLRIVKKRYPNIYRILVTERNEIMARNLIRIMKHYPEQTIMAVVGAGHEDEIIGIIKARINSIDI